ncbi:MAG: acylphosphatase [Anaerococcus vaginalis]|uniref:acylphosphatase n=2 Tax=Anaerococcus TaxID=165779 RepID=A0A6N2R5H1_9FIRM|nr:MULTISPECIES: acylphosphatase [Anaerococcus]MDD7767161.1 acylphosphatase [Anaerococcus vaginalis]MDU0945956.1 acylphosphatase [Anaerococcus vaginalis]MDU1030844.1 acylphosphatase [Anaerococcus vaginalis]MDU4378365.1 acylphosphatase [Anaerococcus vaginalis]MDU4447539.1 acylphosphatase [Anaerococcus vaginalis]
MKRYNMIFKGRVQGVGFRYKSYLLANELGLTGDVNNLYDGDVELNIQGDREKIDLFLEKLAKDRFIRIDDIEIKEKELINDEEKFKLS